MYDVKCSRLAQDFLYDHPDKWNVKNIEKLAQAIQDEIESVIKSLPTNETHENTNPKLQLVPVQGPPEP